MVSSLLGLAPGGGYLATHITADAGGLLRHLFTITFTPCEVSGLSVSVALLRQVSPPRVLPDAVLCGVRTFLDPDIQDRDRPTDLRNYYHTRKGTERQHSFIALKQSS